MDRHKGAPGEGKFGCLTGGKPTRGLLLDSQSANSSNDTNPKEQQNNRTTDAQTMMHILKANIGTGVLAMPNAFKNVGLWSGFVLVPVIGAICIHCMNILIASHNKLCDRFNYESLDYDQVAALGLACGPKLARRLAKRAHIMVTIFLLFTQVGFCCVYIMFVVENLQLAVLNLFEIEYSTTTYLLLVFPVIGLTSCTSNLKHLARISTLANLLQLTGLALIFFDLLQFHTYSSGSGSPFSSHQHRLDKQPVVKQLASGQDLLAGAPLFFATAVYAFEGIGVVLPVIKEMQQPGRILGFNGVLNTSMLMVAVLYMAMGFFGYAKYGQFVQGSITLNLPQTTLNELVRFIFALAIGLSYSLQFYVPWTIMWPHIDESLFYSYRPRVSRDKLDILNRLSAENEWALERAQLDGEQPEEEEVGSCSGGPASERIDYNSTASTFGTSYSTSTYLQHSQQASKGARRLNVSFSAGSQANQYGSIGHSQSAQRVRQPWRRRDRLHDVMELAEDSMPDVEWRPPPRSMRGKRKLVRYTVILVSVSFTCK